MSKPNQRIRFRNRWRRFAAGDESDSNTLGHGIVAGLIQRRQAETVEQEQPSKPRHARRNHKSDFLRAG